MAQEIVRNIDHAIDILYELARDGSSLGVRELARRLQISKSATQRILASLEARSLATHDEETQQYRIGPGVVLLASSYLQRGDLIMHAMPIMERLRDSTEETVCLHTCVELKRVTVLQVESRHELRWRVEIGKPYPLYVGASGKALLAFQPPSVVEQIVSEFGLQPLTPNTVTDGAQLQMDLAHVREQGYAVSFGERVRGGAGIAAPVRDDSGQVVAALSIYGPDSRVTLPVIARIAYEVLQAADQLSAALGYLAPERKIAEVSVSDLVPSRVA